MAFPPHIWSQIKNLRKKDLIKAPERDGWKQDPASRGAELGYLKEGRVRKRIVIHYHPRETLGPKILNDLLRDVGWTESDLRRVGLIK